MIAATTGVSVSATDPLVLVMGRVQVIGDGKVRVGFPGVSIRLAFEGSGAIMTASCSTGDCIVACTVDGVPKGNLRLAAGENQLSLASGLAPGRHQIDLIRQTETWLGVMTVEGFTLSVGAHLAAPEPWPQRRLLFIGDSVTCGEAARRTAACITDKAATWDAAGSYGMLLGKALGASVHLVSYGGKGLIRDWQGKRDDLNAPQFFELATPEPKAARWNHQAYVPDGVFISLGTNDFNHSAGAPPDASEFVSAYESFVKRILELYPKTKVFITEGAILNGGDKATLRSIIEQSIQSVANERVSYLPSTYYPGDSCNAHPTGEQHRAMAKDFEPKLRAQLGW